MALKDDLKTQWRTGGMLTRLIFMNIGVFLIIRGVDLVFWLTGMQGPPIELWLGSNSDLPTLMVKPWSVITYMFTHYDLFHILFNMIVLYFGGRIFADLLGDKRLLGNYILGGICGLALYILSYNLLPAFARFSEGSWIIGASAAVMGVFIGIASYRPELVVNLIFFGAVRLKWIALIILVIDLISIRQGNNSGGHIAHIGGALYGYIAARQLTRGRDISMGLANFLYRIGDLFSKKHRSRMRVSKKAEKARMQAVKKTERDANEQERIDRILDKISRSGYDSLTKQEKDMLFKASHEK